MLTKKIRIAVITVCAFLPRTSAATTLEFDDTSTISVDGGCAKIQNSGGDTFVYNISWLRGIKSKKELVQKTKRAAQTGK